MSDALQVVCAALCVVAGASFGYLIGWLEDLRDERRKERHRCPLIGGKDGIGNDWQCSKWRGHDGRCD